MINRYNRSFACKCPTTGQPIIYHIAIATSGRMLYVEHINTAIALLESAYHEQIADILHAKLGGQQTLTATHEGVLITTQRGEL